MDPSVLIPTPDSIPVHWGWFKFFLILTFMGHLLFMNVMVGTGIIAFFNSLRRDDKSSQDFIEKDVSQKLTFVIAFAINFGVAPLLFVQVLYGHFMYVSSLLMAVWWLSVIGLLIIAYYSAYYYKFKFDALNSLRRYFIGVAILILIFIGFLFTNNMTLMLTPKTWFNYFSNPEGTFLNLSEPMLFPRFLHFMAGSVAVGGLFIAITWYLKQKKGIPGAGENIDQGMKWFTYATLAQIAIGFWFQMSLPRHIMMLFMGDSTTHTTIFVFSLGLVIMTIFFGVKRKVPESAISVGTLIFSMIIMRDMVRDAYLKPYFSVSDLKVTHQYSPLVFFLISLALGIGIIIYIVRLSCRVPGR